MERLTEYHESVAVIRDKSLLQQAMAKLAAYEDTGLTPAEIMDGKMLTGWIPVSERLPEEKGEYLNPYGKYVCKFAKNQGITINEAYEHPTVKARYEFFCKTGA